MTDDIPFYDMDEEEYRGFLIFTAIFTALFSYLDAVAGAIILIGMFHLGLVKIGVGSFCHIYYDVHNGDRPE